MDKTINIKKMKNDGQRKSKLSPVTIAILVFLIVYVVILCTALFWSFLVSFNHPQWYPKYNTYGFPNEKVTFVITNYTNLITKMADITYALKGVRQDIGIVLLNSILYALGCAFFQTLVPFLTAYVCARYRFKFSFILYSTAIVVMTIPIVGSQASELSIAVTLGVYDHIWGLWIMKANFLGMYFLVFYEMFRSLSPTYFEAAEIDGASDLQRMFAIGLPLAKNVFLTVILINFVTYWNDYQIPYLYLPHHMTVATFLYGMTNINTIKGIPSLDAVPYKLAGTIMMIIPTVVLFSIFHKKLLGNLTIGGIKG